MRSAIRRWRPRGARVVTLSGWRRTTEALAAPTGATNAADALEQPLDRFARKKNLVVVAQMHPKLEELREKSLPSRLWKRGGNHGWRETANDGEPETG